MEYAHELVKMSDVLLAQVEDESAKGLLQSMDGEREESVKAVSRLSEEAGGLLETAALVFLAHYGHAHQTYQEVEQKIKMLQYTR